MWVVRQGAAMRPAEVARLIDNHSLIEVTAFTMCRVLKLYAGITGRTFAIIFVVVLQASYVAAATSPSGTVSSSSNSPAWESAYAHPFHVSNAEVEWNEESKSLEVALKVWPIDLEEALENETRRSLDLDKTEDIDQLIVSYLQSRFVFHQADGKPAKIDWLGKEISVKSAWLYFEIPLESSPEGIEVENRLFLEQLPDQVNLLQFKTGRKRMTLRFAADQPKQKIDYSQLKFGL